MSREEEDILEVLRRGTNKIDQCEVLKEAIRHKGFSQIRIAQSVLQISKILQTVICDYFVD